MLILLLVIFIGMIVGCCIKESGNSFWEDSTIGINITGIVGCIASIIAIIVVAISFSCANIIPNKIKVLEEQNLKIETQINSIAEDYLAHEGKTYDKLTPDNVEVFAVAYPQLASNETVTRQMGVYIENNNKITELKLEWCNRNVYAWWLYFGGE